MPTWDSGVLKTLIRFNNINMNKYVVGILLIATLYGCMEHIKEPEKKLTALCCRPVNAMASLNRASISEKSIFQLTDSFQTQEDKSFNLSMLKGKPAVVGMIFTHCTSACPRLTADIQNIADSLNQEKVNFVLVSFDTKRDNPARLREFSDKMGLGRNWILLHGSDDAVRTLSVLLNVQYEQDGEGNFSHSNLVSVLDKDGVLQYQKEGLGAEQGETINVIRNLTAQK